MKVNPTLPAGSRLAAISDEVNTSRRITAAAIIAAIFRIFFRLLFQWLSLIY